MYSASLLLVLLSLCVCAPRTPRVYNVLISTKKNLAPSQALPVYEPVLRTTSVGLAFPPLIYTPISSIKNSPNRYIHDGSFAHDIIRPLSQPLEEAQESTQKQYAISNPLQPSSAKSLPGNVLPLDQYFPYYTRQLNYLPEGASYQKEQPRLAAMDLERYINNVSDPKQIVANLRKNSDIPDVPPPPLPVKN